MDLSPGVKFLMMVAAGEAINLSSTDLDVEHLFLGLLKIEDFSSGDPPPVEIPEREWQQAMEEIGVLQVQWQRKKVNCKPVHRRLRKLIQESQPVNLNQSEFSGHRTPRCRAVFDKAKAYARQQGENQIGLLAILAACLQEESQTLDTLFQEMGWQREDLLPEVVPE